MTHKPQIKIPATYMRGGTSKGVFFSLTDLPEAAQVPGEARDKILLRTIGSPDPYGQQIDGMGGATSSTSKTVILAKSEQPDHDVDYLFGQVAINKAFVDWSGNCGNLTAAVGAFAISKGLVDAERIPENGVCVVRIWQKNIKKTIIAHVRKATVGTPSVLNTHPFSWGKFSFAHNGTVTGFERFSDQLAKETACDIQAERLGQTDSEQYFLWLLSQLRTYGFIDLARLQFNAGKTEQLAVFLKERVVSLNQRCLSAVIDKVPRLNFVLTDGHVLVACRWNNSLHTIRREGIYDCEICGIPHIHHHETVSHRAQAFASEPITNEPWVEIANQSVVLAKL